MRLFFLYSTLRGNQYVGQAVIRNQLAAVRLERREIRFVRVDICEGELASVSSDDEYARTTHASAAYLAMISSISRNRFAAVSWSRPQAILIDGSPFARSSLKSQETARNFCLRLRPRSRPPTAVPEPSAS